MTAEPFDFTEWSLTTQVVPDPDLADRVGAPMLAEVARRRPGWTDGPPIRGADGQLWRFPRIDLALVATVPKLFDEVREVYRLAHDWSLLAADAPGRFAAKLRHDMAMIRVACRLLSVNYRWDDREEPPIPPGSLGEAVAAFADIDPAGWSFPGMFPPQLLNHRDPMGCCSVLGQAGRVVDRVFEMGAPFRSAHRGSPSRN